MITPYLISSSAADAIAFYVHVFGAEEIVRLQWPDGRVAHAELRLGGGVLMLADEHPGEGYVGPRTLGGSPVSLYLRVQDVDALHARAVAAGASERAAPANQMDGDRRGSFVDPFGHVWAVATLLEELAPAELVQRFQKLTSNSGELR